LTNSVGGIIEYFKLFITHNPIQQITFFQNLGQFSIYFTYPVFGAICVTSYLVIQKIIFKKNIKLKNIFTKNTYDENLKWILFWWIIPPCCFFVFIHYTKGTMLLCTAGLILLIPFLLRNNSINSKIYVLIIFIQVSFFLFANYKVPDVQVYFTRSVRKINFHHMYF